MLPALVQASAQGIEGAKLTILNGSQGMNDVATGIAAQGLSVYDALRGALTASANGAASPAKRSDDVVGDVPWSKPPPESTRSA